MAASRSTRSSVEQGAVGADARRDALVLGVGEQVEEVVPEEGLAAAEVDLEHVGGREVVDDAQALARSSAPRAARRAGRPTGSGGTRGCTASVISHVTLTGARSASSVSAVDRTDQSLRPRVSGAGGAMPRGVALPGRATRSSRSPPAGRGDTIRRLARAHEGQRWWCGCRRRAGRSPPASPAPSLGTTYRGSSGGSVHAADAIDGEVLDLDLVDEKVAPAGTPSRASTPSDPSSLSLTSRTSS